MVAKLWLLPAALAYNPLFEAQWKEFKVEFNKQYASEEEELKHKAFFQQNLADLEDMNKADKNWIPYGHLSPLADMNKAVFKRRNSLQAQLRTSSFQTSDVFQQYPPLADDVTAFDWRGKGAVNPVKNQGQCGSCWSFATVANIEGVYAAHNNTLISLSEQQLVDCDENDNGCDGGLPELADKWLIAHKTGLETEARYPYTGVVGDCAQDPSRERLFVAQFLQISQDEDMMARALMQHGPLAIGINANMMQMYMGGIAQPDDDACDPSELNHGVALVGFGEEATPRNPQAVKQMLEMQQGMKTQGLLLESPKLNLASDEKTKFWIIRNSWGEEWGEKGYYRIVRGKGACGMNTMVTTAENVSYKPAPKAENLIRSMKTPKDTMASHEYYI